MPNEENGSSKNQADSKVIRQTIPETNENSITGIKFRILILTESFHPYTSGIARRFKEIIERLAQQNFLIHVVTGCKGCETWTSKKELNSFVTFSSLRAIEFKDKLDCALPFLLPQYGIFREIKKFKPDIIHCVEQTPASTFCGALAKTLNIPIVWSSHTNLDYYIPLYITQFMSPISLHVYQKLRRQFLNISNYNLTVSNEFVSQLKENGITSAIYVWKTGVDSDAFSPLYRSEEMRMRMFNGHYAPNKLLLVSVGRLSPEKNFEFLLKILEHFPQAFLCIVGGGPYKESLEPLFPPDQTNFMGFLQGAELAAAYASADLFVYASVSETFGQVYLEAMSSGIPIVAAEGKQMKEFHFLNGVHGYTWQPANVDSAVAAMSNAIKNRNILAANCRANALSHSWGSAAVQIAQVYTQLIDESKTNKKKQSTLKTIILAVKYLSVWLYLNILIVLFMVPFMNVSKPNDKARDQEAYTIKLNSKKRNSLLSQLSDNFTLMFHAKKKRFGLFLSYLKHCVHTLNLYSTVDGFWSDQCKKASALVISVISLTAIYALFIHY